MAITTELSAELSATLAALNESNSVSGKFRVHTFTFTQGAAAGDIGSTCGLVKLPAGKVRVLAGMSRLDNSAFGAARTISVGTAAYTQPDGTAVAASSATFLSAGAVASAQAGTLKLDSALASTTGGTAVYDSKDGVTVEATVAGGTIPAGATLTGYIAYVLD